MTQTVDPTVERFGVRWAGGLSAVLYVATVVVAVGLFVATGLFEARSAAGALPVFADSPTITALAGWLFVAAPIALAMAGLGVYVAVRRAGSLVTLGLLAILGGSLLVLIRNVFWLAMGTELAPAYAGSTGEGPDIHVAIGDTLLGVGTILGDQVGGVLIAGVAVPILSVAMLRIRFGSRWLARLGFVVALSAPFTYFATVGELFELINLLGFVAFLVWMAAVGSALLRLPRAHSRQGTPT